MVVHDLPRDAFALCPMARYGTPYPAALQIEPGYHCTGFNPSVCEEQGAAQQRAGGSSRSAWDSSGAGTGGSGDSAGPAETAAIAVLSCIAGALLLALVGVVLARVRHHVQHIAPQVGISKMFSRNGVPVESE